VTWEYVSRRGATAIRLVPEGRPESAVSLDAEHLDWLRACYERAGVSTPAGYKTPA
jgi:hypothetical protein